MEKKLKFMKIGNEQFLNYLATDIAETLLTYPTQNQIDMLEKILTILAPMTFADTPNAKHSKITPTLN